MVCCTKSRRRLYVIGLIVATVYTALKLLLARLRLVCNKLFSFELPQLQVNNFLALIF